MEILKGYIKTKGKKPIEPYRNKKSFYNYDYIRKTGGDFAGILADGMVQIDIDDEKEGKLVKQIVAELGVKSAILKTDRGIHFYFRNTEVKRKQTKLMTPIGVKVDVAVGEQNALVPLKVNGKTRRWLNKIDTVEEIDFLPEWLKPLKKKSIPDFKSLEEGDGRNQALFNYILTLQSEGFSKDSIKNIIKIINQYVLKTPLSDKEVDTILRDEAFLKQTFYIKSKFLHDKFAKFLKNEEHIIKINSQLHLYKDGIYKNDLEEIETAMIKHLPELTQSKRNETMHYLRLIAKEVKPKYEDYNLIAFNNGIYNIKNDSFIDHSPEYIITNKIPWDYNPSAYWELTDKTLDKISCNDSEIRAVLEELIGYTFYRRNEIGKTFILTGEKLNGKSTFLDMVTNLIGIKNIAALDLKELGERFKTAELFGKLANIGDDIGDEFIANPSIFKKLVTGERINVEKKGQDPFDFNNYSKLLFSANNIPRVKDKTGAVQRRLLIVPFNAKFSPDDPDFKPHIKYELRSRESMEYLILLGIKGLKRVLKNRCFTKSSKVEKELKEYEKTNNPIIGFHEEYEKEIENEITGEVYKKYLEYCLNNNFQPLSHIEFSRQINKRFEFKIIDKRINGKKYRIFVKNE
ncbi:DNA primase family protein [Paramaledivibacter caminithermalis]|uniref:Putative DNA primase/helicase n=1 Tax=Paramaledivibacter caminithermalis (strain DSM 15212 / CIP 107654 / DViRD3) TaxID=1121301 RepID=A0A1M6M252_PARC5|nr:DNA primase family protein [Paramaledivibacter caminithermalis]SHJ77535.1 putative DNA primase/helicase [Paramaledivibacter caminithermalis DSM 15212]